MTTKEEYEADRIEEDFREKHQKEFLVKFRGSTYIEALDEEEAISKAQDKDLSEWVDEWKTD